MNIQLLSDLHLEANPDFVPQPAPGADLLVLAGDVGSYQKRRDGSVMDEPDWGLQRFARWPVPVLFVPGNHEYDALDVDEAHERLRETCERLGLLWLERETRVMQGVRFVGTTLWSDYDVLGQREKAFRAANHYLVKMASERDGQLFDAEAMRALAVDCQRWLRRRWPSPSKAPRWWSRISHPRCTAWTRAMARARAPRASATRWTTGCRRPTSGCMATCIAPPMCRSGAAASWPTRWVTPTRTSRAPLWRSNSSPCRSAARPPPLSQRKADRRRGHTLATDPTR
jgi:hypothetical protein